VLFRSAAMSYGPRVIGVLQSGADDDGTAGMIAIKRCGGATIVQDPVESEYPEMPASALHAVGPDFKCQVSEIGSLVGGLVKGSTRTGLAESTDQGHRQQAFVRCAAKVRPVTFWRVDGEPWLRG
jgi:two-component system chemotaxis response regulator CheB